MSAYQPTEFAREMRAHMEDWSTDACRRPPMWSLWLEGIHPDYRDIAREVQVADEVKLHNYTAHLLSSQAFALHLFLPFRESSRKALSERVSRAVSTRLLVEEVRFEWVPPGALLGELEGDPELRSTACRRRQDAVALRMITRARPEAPGAAG